MKLYIPYKFNLVLITLCFISAITTVSASALLDIKKEILLPKTTFTNIANPISYTFTVNPKVRTYIKSIAVIPVVGKSIALSSQINTCNAIQNGQCTWNAIITAKSQGAHQIYLKYKLMGEAYDAKAATLEKTKFISQPLFGHFQFKDAKGNPINHLEIIPGTSGFVTLENTGDMPISNIKINFSSDTFSQYFSDSSCLPGMSLAIGSQCKFIYHFPKDVQAGFISLSGNKTDNNKIELRAAQKGGQLFIVGNRGTIYISEDAGKSWKLEKSILPII